MKWKKSYWIFLGIIILVLYTTPEIKKESSPYAQFRTSSIDYPAIHTIAYNTDCDGSDLEQYELDTFAGSTSYDTCEDWLGPALIYNVPMTDNPITSFTLNCVNPEEVNLYMHPNEPYLCCIKTYGGIFYSVYDATGVTEPAMSQYPDREVACEGTGSPCPEGSSCGDGGICHNDVCTWDEFNFIDHIEGEIDVDNMCVFGDPCHVDGVWGYWLGGNAAMYRVGNIQVELHNLHINNPPISPSDINFLQDGTMPLSYVEETFAQGAIDTLTYVTSGCPPRTYEQCSTYEGWEEIYLLRAQGICTWEELDECTVIWDASYNHFLYVTGDYIQATPESSLGNLITEANGWING